MRLIGDGEIFFRVDEDNDCPCLRLFNSILLKKIDIDKFAETIESDYFCVIDKYFLRFGKITDNINKKNKLIKLYKHRLKQKYKDREDCLIRICVHHKFVTP
ncbi:MAG: hypothetical protein GXO62_07460, partial [Epsilonproteobacteria bacterium]|nr:hypothetical protein [Campylobacterota bacterium]